MSGPSPASGVNPWDQRSDESDKAYAAFDMYLRMGKGRSAAKVGEELGKSGGLMERWCARHEWVARVRAWDRFVLERERRKKLEENEKARQRQLQTAVTMQAAVIASLQNAYFEEYTDDDGKTRKRVSKDLTPHQLVRLFEAGVKVEKQIRGEETNGSVPRDRVQAYLIRLFDALGDACRTEEERERITAAVLSVTPDF